MAMRFTRQWKEKYGITSDDFEQMFEQQQGLCKVCGGAFGGKRGPCVDHDHVTGKVRGLLCTKCNTGLGYFWDSEVLLQRAAKYLEEASK